MGIHKGHRRLTAALLVTAVLGAVLATAATAAPPDPLPASTWAEQFRADDGTWIDDMAIGPDGQIVVVGFARGDLGDQDAIGGLDAYVRMYDPNGTVMWTRQFGTSISDVASDVVWLDREVFVVAGWTEGLLGEAANADHDVFMQAMDRHGNVRWIEQFGTDERDQPAGIVATTDLIAIAGNTDGDLDGTGVADDDGDAFIRVLDHDGTLQWSDQFGTAAADAAYDITVIDDAGTISFALGGETAGDLGGPNAGATDAWIRFYDTTGGVDATQQFGSADADRLVSLDASSERLQVVGTTLGDLYTAGLGASLFASSHELDGTLIWGNHLTSPDAERATRVLAFGEAMVFSGHTDGDLLEPNAGAVDGVMAAADAAGSILWADQIGTEFEDIVWALGAGTDGTLFFGGSTQGDLFDTNQTELDWQEAWLSAHAPPADAAPDEPTTVEIRPRAGALEIRWDGRSGAGTDTTVTLTGGTSCETGALVCIISGLDADETYAATVEITNSVGTTAADPTAAISPLELCDGTQPLPFDDVPSTSFALADVACIFAIDVTTGTTVDTYSPADDVTREQMAAFLARLYRYLTGEDCGGDHPFTDVPATSFAADDVGCIFELEVTTGTSATTYSPADPVTREQMAAFLARLFRTISEQPCATTDHPFDDVPATSFAAGDVGCIYELEVTTGTSSTTYSPTADVTREQMAAFLARLYRLLSDPTGIG